MSEKLKRYRCGSKTMWCGPQLGNQRTSVMEDSPEGEWVRYSDVAPVDSVGVDRVPTAVRMLERIYEAADALGDNGFHKWLDDEFWPELEGFCNSAALTAPADGCEGCPARGWKCEHGIIEVTCKAKNGHADEWMECAMRLEATPTEPQPCKTCGGSGESDQHDREMPPNHYECESCGGTGTEGDT